MEKVSTFDDRTANAHAFISPTAIGMYSAVGSSFTCARRELCIAGRFLSYGTSRPWGRVRELRDSNKASSVSRIAMCSDSSLEGSLLKHLRDVNRSRLRKRRRPANKIPDRTQAGASGTRQPRDGNGQPNPRSARTKIATDGKPPGSAMPVRLNNVQTERAEPGTPKAPVPECLEVQIIASSPVLSNISPPTAKPAERHPVATRSPDNRSVSKGPSNVPSRKVHSSAIQPPPQDVSRNEERPDMLPGERWIQKLSGRLLWAGNKIVEEGAHAVSPELVLVPTISKLGVKTGLSRAENTTGSLPRASCAKPNMPASPVPVASKVTPKRMSNAPMPPSQTGPSLAASLNDAQSQAVLFPPGSPCLVLAGPGSGKTRVLTHRAAHLVRALGVPSRKIVAVTFTNKAAAEMKTRIAKLLAHEATDVDDELEAMTVGTFHSICARILRQYGEHIGISSNFVICDTTDAKAVMEDVIKEYMGDAASPDEAGTFLRQISKMKNDGEEDLQNAMFDSAFNRLQQIRQIYDERLRAMNRLDFDDLLLESRRLLLEVDDVRVLLQRRFHHILVDEWQDTNALQYDVVRILAAEHRNLFVVGDADQSIYRFRGADVRNIGRFSSDFPDAVTIALVENYRSTGCIVQAAQSIIEENKSRPEKSMRTANEFGRKIKVTTAYGPSDEAYSIAFSIRSLLRGGDLSGYSSAAVLYRTHAQSRSFEEVFVRLGIPYRLYGGLRFFDRQEVKDVISYLRLMANELDDLSLRRAINTPPRGIGVRTVQKLEEYARKSGLSTMQALRSVCEAETVPEGVGLRANAVKRLQAFYDLIHRLSCEQIEQNLGAEDIISRVIAEAELEEYVKHGIDPSQTPERASERWNNVQELQASAARYASLEEFLQNVALMSGTDDVDTEDGEERQAVGLMTLHGVKGLEFPHVYIAGMEEGLIPMTRDPTEASIEEERRLAYVGITRARSQLNIYWRLNRTAFGTGKARMFPAEPSRFLRNIPEALTARDVTNEAMSAMTKGADVGDIDSQKRKGRTGHGKTPRNRNTVIKSYGSDGRLD